MDEMTHNIAKEPVQTIDIGEVITKKFKRNVPPFVVKLLENLIHQEEINRVLRTYGHLKGVDFASALVNYFGLTLNVINRELLPQNKRALFICNHPLGALDGICLTHLIGHHYNSEIRYIVNDMLLFLQPFQSIFVPINTISAQARENVHKLNEALSSDFPVLTFPAGICSRKIYGKVQDLPWKKSFINQAIRSKRDIVPLYFDGYNTRFFYIIESIRKKIGLKFNIGTTLLPDQMFRSKNKHFTIYVGKPFSYEELKNSSFAKEELTLLFRETVYSLPKKHNKRVD